MVLIPSSFGDIVAIVSLIHQIYQVLSDSARSSAEYRCLILDLHSFEEALSLVGEILEAPLCKSHRQLIQTEIARCSKLLRDFWRLIQPYERVLTGGRSYTAWPKKTVWAINMRSKVMSFRQEILQHKINIILYLQIMRTNETQPMTSCIKHDDANSLILIDALGEHITLRMEFCFSPDELHETLTRLFKGKIGQSHVERHDYRISTKDGKSMVELDNWGSIVKKGSVIVMSIIVKKTPQDSSERSICPRCHKTEVGVMLDDGWMQCRRCAKRFTCADKTIKERQPPRQEENMADFHNIHIVFVKRKMILADVNLDMRLDDDLRRRLDRVHDDWMRENLIRDTVDHTEGSH